jgi:hypothetical protein
MLEAYAAGLLDGEGCFVIRENEYISVSVASQHLGVLKELQQRWRGTIYNHGRVYKWQFTHPLWMGAFLRDVLPHLRIKRALAVNMLAYLDVRHNTLADDFAAKNKALNKYLSMNFAPLVKPLKWEDKQASTETKGGE